MLITTNEGVTSVDPLSPYFMHQFVTDIDNLVKDEGEDPDTT